jgi:hypothetical protein
VLLCWQGGHLGGGRGRVPATDSRPRRSSDSSTACAVRLKSPGRQCRHFDSQAHRCYLNTRAGARRLERLVFLRWQGGPLRDGGRVPATDSTADQGVAGLLLSAVCRW